MALVVCPERVRKVLDKAFACPSCGFGGVAGTYISAKAVTTVIVGCVMFLAFAAIMIALILR